MSKPTSDNLDVFVCRKPSELPPPALTVLHQHEIDANVILPILNKCRRHEQKGIISQDHLWIVVFVRSPVYAVKLILACTDGLTGKYPLFLFTPLPYAVMKDDASIYPSLFSMARHLQAHVPTHRVFSVFGRELLARTFATIWAQQTKIPFIVDPYYHCKITYLTPTTLEHSRRELPPIPTAQIRPAEQRDWEGVARICHDFAADAVRELSWNTFSYSLFVVAPLHSDQRRRPCRSPRAHRKQSCLGSDFGARLCRLTCCFYS
jgi:hypothetical protein